MSDSGKRGRGRPIKQFLQDDDRYAIACAVGLRDALNVSERKSFDFAVAVFFGVMTDTSANTVQYKLVREPGAPATIAGRAATLRQKANKNKTPDEAVWLIVMAQCWTIALMATGYEAGAARIRELAVSIDETTFAEERLIPFLAAKFAPLIFSRGGD